MRRRSTNGTGAGRHRDTALRIFLQRNGGKRATRTMYAPDSSDLRDVAKELYDEVGRIAMTLIATKIKRARRKL